MGEKNNMDMPKVLVFSSCYNHEEYVADAIESVLNQTYENIEFLLVNDGSTDKSAEVINRYIDDKRLTFIDLKENTSAVGAYNIINNYINNSDAKYIAGFSTDDKWKKDKIEKQIDFLENNKSYKACFTWDEIIIKNGASSNLPQGYSHVANADRFSNLRRLILMSNYYNACSVVMYREAYIEVGGYNWTFRALQDYFLWIKFQLKYPVYLLEESLTYYRKHDTNISGNFLACMRDRNESFYIYSYLMNNIDDYLFKKIFFNEFIYYDSETHMEILAEKIAMLMRTGNNIHMQVAFNLFFENSSNTEFVQLMDSKFMLSQKLVHKLTGDYGIIYILTDHTPDVKYDFNDFYALLKFIPSKHKNLHSIKYSALIKLFKINSASDNSVEDFLNIKNYIDDYRGKLSLRGDTLLIIGEEYNKVYEDFIKDFDYISILPLKEKMFIESSEISELEFETRKEITMFDKIEHSIVPIWELTDYCVKRIILLGCCNERYPITEVINNISLDVELEYYPLETDTFDEIKIIANPINTNKM